MPGGLVDFRGVALFLFNLDRDSFFKYDSYNRHGLLPVSIAEVGYERTQIHSEALTWQ
jgi:hypothetical protein